MKIPEKPDVLLERTILGGSGKARSGRGSEVSKVPEADPGFSSDPVDISGQAMSLQKLTGMTSTSNDTRSQRIEQIRDEIASGTYLPDSKQIAEKIVRSTILDNIS